jgi:hypothetical protein
MIEQIVVDLDKAQRIYNAYVSPRARTLILWESEVDGTRFDGRKPWTDTEVPIYERKPVIVYKAVKNAIKSKVDLLLGEGRFPAVTARPDEDEQDKEDELAEKASEMVDKAITGIIKETKLRKLLREGYATAQTCGTMVFLLGVRRRRLFGETLPAKWCEPKRNENGDVVSITVCYPFIRTQQVQGKWTATCMLYRREIDDKADTIFKPAVALSDGTMPSFTVQARSEHGLGFCPVKWYRYDAPMQNVETEDGNPPHKDLLDELEGIDYALSQRHHGALSSLPQIIEIGVDPGYNPTSSGEVGQQIQVTMNGGTPGPSNPVRGAYQTAPSRGHMGARKKGPNHVWQYSSTDTKVEAINTPGEALEAINVHIKDLRSKICEALAWVPLDPESIKFAATVSGKALEILRERELNRVSQDREDFGDQVILGTVCMLLRIALHFGAQLNTPGLKKAIPALTGMVSVGEWEDPALSLKWPSYFLQSPEDNQKTVDLAIKAFDGGIITKRTQVETVRRIFGIDNVTAYLEQLEEEAEAKAAKALEEQQQMMTRLHASGLGGLDPDENDDKPGAGGNKEGPPTGGSGKPGGFPGPKKAAPQVGKPFGG